MDSFSIGDAVDVQDSSGLWTNGEVVQLTD